MTARRTISTLLVAAALAGYATVAGAASDPRPAHKVVVVADASVPQARVDAALRLAGPGAEIRFPRTPTEQLSVTHLFAARGYTIVGLGLTKEVAVDPVERAYPGVRFELR
jgi:hypothetical protein